MTIRMFFLTVAALFLGCSATRPHLNDAHSAGTLKHAQKRAMSHYISGAMYDFERQYINALREYQRALALDTASAQIRKAIGRNYIRLNRHVEALPYLDNAHQRNERDRETLHYLAETHFELKNFERSAFFYEQLRAIDPYDPAVYKNLVYLYTQLGNMDTLIAVRESQAELLFYEPEVATQLWRLYLQTRQNDKALVLSQRLVDQHPADARLWVIHGNSHEFARDTTAAIQAYRKALAVEPGNERALSQLSALYAQQQDWLGMQSFFNDFLARNPGQAIARFMLAESYLAREMFHAAGEAVQPLLSDTANAAQANLLLGRIAIQQERLDDARNYFRTVTRLAPWNSRAWEFLGILYFQEQNFTMIDQLMQEALQALPDDPGLLSLHGNALQQLGRNREAIAPLEKAYQLVPDDLNIIVTLGIVYDDLNMYSALDTLYADAMMRFPDNALLFNNYSYSLAVRGMRLEWALTLAQKAVRLEPENAAYHDTMGWVYFRMGNLAAARQHIEQSLVLDPDNPEVIEHLGDVYVEMGEKDLGRQYWQQALELDPDNTELRRKWLGE